jgi:hypothetical protein
MKDQRAPNPDEWEFHRIPSGEVSTALRWELCREAGLVPWSFSFSLAA